MDAISYAAKPEDVEAVVITPENREEAATWSGGMVLNETLYVPTINGRLMVLDGEVLARNKQTGRFGTYHKDIFERRFGAVDPT